MENFIARKRNKYFLSYEVGLSMWRTIVSSFHMSKSKLSNKQIMVFELMKINSQLVFINSQLISNYSEFVSNYSQLVSGKFPLISSQLQLMFCSHHIVYIMVDLFKFITDICTLWWKFLTIELHKKKRMLLHPLPFMWFTD